MKFKNRIPGKPQIVMTHTVSNTPGENISFADGFHEVNIENYNALTAYIEKHNLKNKSAWLMPHFIGSNEVNVVLSKEELRKKYNIKTSKVILSVGMIMSYNKKMDHIIREAARLPDDWTLILCGRLAEPALMDLGKKLMGDRFQRLELPLSQMPEIYKASDLFVMGSIQEGFGIVAIEAMAMGLPVILHDRELFNWILKDSECCLDMNQENLLSDFILKKSKEADWFTIKGKENQLLAEKYYVWESVKDQYYKMYN